MQTIVKLDKHLMNMIAAGEVVERPAGIVKELVENALDAKADVIEVVFKNGGIDYLSVSDNGFGMSRIDARLAFEHHATSKLKQESDLWAIGTMGFRGEALPSIASVAKVELITNNKQESSSIKIHYGELMSDQSVASNVGTKVIVEGLFHKTPARLKAFKSVNYERAIIVSTMEKFALAYPNISFIVKDDDKIILHTSGQDDLKEIMYHLYGRNVAAKTILFEEQNSDFKISGALVLPDETRANRSHIQVFVNQRMIRSSKLSNDVIEAYRHLMFKERYPIVVLKIELDTQLVDVNVHPSKWEVRIAKEKNLSELIQAGLRNVLMKHLEAKNIQKTSSVEAVLLQHKMDFYSRSEPIEQVIETEHRTADIHQSVFTPTSVLPVQPLISDDKDDDAAFVSDTYQSRVQDVDPVQTRELDQLQVIGQLHGKYILAETPDALYVIDQHAAEERTNFEKIRKQLDENIVESTPLLMPVMVDFKVGDQHVVDTLISVLEPMGFSIELFSEQSLVVREIPLWMINDDLEAFMIDVIELLKSDKQVNLQTLRYDVIANKACKASIKFNQKLSLDVMQQVVTNLSKTKEPYHCPHGRPTLIKLSEAQLIKEFMR
ncbi:MAG: DNA mismatch repair endonuclease MutL [Erysipelothrix sp.]|nr:DNA mismatch repair endonuclease MutL [Erysipelothrix sp.]